MQYETGRRAGCVKHINLTGVQNTSSEQFLWSYCGVRGDAIRVGVWALQTLMMRCCVHQYMIHHALLAAYRGHVSAVWEIHVCVCDCHIHV